VTDFAVTRREPSLGWWGMALFVAAEATLFGVLVATYFYLRFKNLEWPPQGIPEPKLGVPLVLLGVLLVTSVPMQLALRAANARRVGASRLLLGLASIVQAGYFAMQVHEYAGDLGRFAPADHAYASIYYTLLGADHAHVALGLLLDLWLLAKLAGGLTRYRLNALSAITFYWHAVNVLTIAVTLTILSPSL
jgi:cytochrome c oxidase subunit III